MLQHREYGYSITRSLLTDPAEVAIAVANVIGNETFSATLTCDVQGIPLPVVAWSTKNLSANMSKVIPNNTFKYLIEEMVTDSLEGLIHVRSILTIMNLSLEDESTYRCAGSNNVTNQLGVMSAAEIILTVQGSNLFIKPVP